MIITQLQTGTAKINEKDIEIYIQQDLYQYPIIALSTLTYSTTKVEVHTCPINELFLISPTYHPKPRIYGLKRIVISSGKFSEIRTVLVADVPETPLKLSFYTEKSTCPFCGLNIP